MRPTTGFQKPCFSFGVSMDIAIGTSIDLSHFVLTHLHVNNLEKCHTNEIEQITFIKVLAVLVNFEWNELKIMQLCNIQRKSARKALVEAK